MRYIIGYSANKSKVRWYVSNESLPMMGMTNLKAEAHRFETSDGASSMLKILKSIRAYDWKIEEVRR